MTTEEQGVINIGSFTIERYVKTVFKCLFFLLNGVTHCTCAYSSKVNKTIYFLPTHFILTRRIRIYHFIADFSVVQSHNEFTARVLCM